MYYHEHHIQVTKQGKAQVELIRAGQTITPGGSSSPLVVNTVCGVS